MASVNKVILIGNLGADPELSYIPSGTAKVTMRLATARIWTDGNGDKKEATEWHRLIGWGRLAEVCGEYLTKGRQIYVEGHLQTRKWTDKDGVDRWTTEIVVSNMQMLGSRPADAEEVDEPEDKKAKKNSKKDKKKNSDDSPFDK